MLTRAILMASLFQRPLTYVDGDSRRYLSFWGYGRKDALTANSTGGCCASTYGTHDGWGQSYTLAYGLALPPPPADTFIPSEPFVDVDGQTAACTLGYWREKCKDVPTTAAYIMLDMGASIKTKLQRPIPPVCNTLREREGRGGRERERERVCVCVCGY